MFRFSAVRGQTIDFDIDTIQNGPGGLGSHLRIFNSNGTELAFNNDAAAPAKVASGLIRTFGNISSDWNLLRRRFQLE